jgi:hypothetical protein
MLTSCHLKSQVLYFAVRPSLCATNSIRATAPSWRVILRTPICGKHLKAGEAERQKYAVKIDRSKIEEVAVIRYLLCFRTATDNLVSTVFSAHGPYFPKLAFARLKQPCLPSTSFPRQLHVVASSALVCIPFLDSSTRAHGYS